MEMLTDLKLALRQLRKSPGFTLTAIVTLALGIGANAVVFSVLNALILKPVNVPQGQNLYMVQRDQVPSNSYLDYLDLRDRNRSFQSLMMEQIVGAVGVDTGGNPSTAWPELVSGNYFDGLGIQPYLGRFIHPADEKGYDSAPYVVLSYDYWLRHFGGDRGVVGRMVEINKHPFTIIGVAPESFRGAELFFAPAFWIPLVDEPVVSGFNDLQYRGNHSPYILGRLRPGVTPGEATAELQSLAAWLAKTYPSDDDGVQFSLARPGLLGDMIGGPARAFLGGLMLLAGLILLAACANLGSLFAARTADRSKEVALRLALGSRRGRILRQLLTESLLVSVAGGVVGLAGSMAILHGLSVWQPISSMPIQFPVNPDLRTYIVALALSLGSGLLFGLVPIRQILRADPWQTIRSGMSGTLEMRRFTLRDLLLVAQIAICAVLVTSSLVAVRGLMRSLHSNFGFKPENAMLVETDLQMSGYDKDNWGAMQRRMLDAAAAIPGVSAVGYTDNRPLDMGGSDWEVFADNVTDYRPTNAIADSMTYRISPGYLDAAGTRLLAGRNLTLADGKDAPSVLLINRQFAVKAFGSVQKALGGHIKFWAGERRAEVVGVVEDGKYRSLTEEQRPAMFVSFLQYQNDQTLLVVRSRRDPAEMAAALDHSLHGVDSSLPLKIRPWTQAMDTALFPARVASVALGVLGLLGAMLAVTGVFGMASYVVSKRMRELGIRVALGAGRREILRTALGRALRLLLIGSVAGLALGLLATRLLSYIVYQASPQDPFVLAGVTITMLALGLLAASIPARRALSVDPVILLREE
jgi:predicted permease